MSCPNEFIRHPKGGITIPDIGSPLKVTGGCEGVPSPARALSFYAGERHFGGDAPSLVALAQVEMDLPDFADFTNQMVHLLKRYGSPARIRGRTLCPD